MGKEVKITAITQFVTVVLSVVVSVRAVDGVVALSCLGPKP